MKRAGPPQEEFAGDAKFAFFALKSQAGLSHKQASDVMVHFEKKAVDALRGVAGWKQPAQMPAFLPRSCWRGVSRGREQLLRLAARMQHHSWIAAAGLVGRLDDVSSAEWELAGDNPFVLCRLAPYASCVTFPRPKDAPPLSMTHKRYGFCGALLREQKRMRPTEVESALARAGLAGPRPSAAGGGGLDDVLEFDPSFGRRDKHRLHFSTEQSFAQTKQRVPDAGFFEWRDYTQLRNALVLSDRADTAGVWWRRTLDAREFLSEFLPDLVAGRVPERGQHTAPTQDTPEDCGEPSGASRRA